MTWQSDMGMPDNWTLPGVPYNDPSQADPSLGTNVLMPDGTYKNFPAGQTPHIFISNSIPGGWGAAAPGTPEYDHYQSVMQRNDYQGVLKVGAIVGGAALAGYLTSASAAGASTSEAYNTIQTSAVAGNQAFQDAATTLTPYGSSSIISGTDLATGATSSFAGAGGELGMIDPALANSVYGGMLDGSMAGAGAAAGAASGAALDPMLQSISDTAAGGPAVSSSAVTTGANAAGYGATAATAADAALNASSAAPVGGPETGTPNVPNAPVDNTNPLVQAGQDPALNAANTASGFDPNWLKPIADILGGVLGANAMSNASDKAAQIQADSAQKQLDFLKQNRDIALANNQPFLDTAYGAMNKMNQMVGNPTVNAPIGGVLNYATGAVNPSGTAGSNSVMNQPGYMPGPNQSPGGVMSPDQIMSMDPGYQFRMSQGATALGYKTAANGYSTVLPGNDPTGNSVSGGFAQSLLRYGQGYASNEFQNIYNRLGTLAGYGIPASANNNSALNTSSTAGVNAIDTSGTQSAYNALNQGNITASLIGNIANQDWGSIFNRHG